jgi:hypothetical protein
LELIGLLTLNLLAEEHRWTELEPRIGPILFFAYERTAHLSALTFGSGLLLVALLGGMLNAGGAALLQRRV